MLRLCAGFALVALVAAAQAAQPGENLVAPRPAPLTIAPSTSDTDLLLAYQYRSARSRPSDATPGRFEFDDGTSSPPPPLSWHPTYGGISLRNLSTVEIKVAETNVMLRRHSVSIDGGQFKLTFSPDMALIQKDGIQVMLQPHHASILWIKTF